MVDVQRRRHAQALEIAALESQPPASRASGGRAGKGQGEGGRCQGPRSKGIEVQMVFHSRRDRPPAGKAARTGDVADKDAAMANGEVDETDEDAMLRRVMGFAAFNTTKNKKVPGNDKNYGVRKDKKTKYRQYMNRQGGFHCRPLESLIGMVFSSHWTHNEHGV